MTSKALHNSFQIGILDILASLGKFESIDRTILFYINALNTIFDDINISYDSNRTNNKGKYFIEIISSEKSHGYLYIDGDLNKEDVETAEIIQKSVQILASFLDRIELKTILSTGEKYSGRVINNKSFESTNELHLLKNIANNTPDIVMVFKKDLQCVFTNKNVHLLGKGFLKNQIDKNIDEFDVSELIKKSIKSSLIKVLKFKSPQLQLISPPHSGRIYEFRLIPEKDRFKDIIRILVLGRDITERHKTERELIMAKEKAEELDRLKLAFMANISHEIRTPLNGIIGFSRLLFRKNIPENKKEEYMRIIESSTESLMRTISNILEISKMESGEFTIIKEDFYLKDFMQNVFTDYKNILEKVRIKEIDFILEQNEEKNNVIINSDEYRLKEILNNLFDNAFKFTSKGFVKFGGFERNQQIIFYVKDSGIGVAKKNQALIFNRFFQEDSTERKEYGGLGLGLTISKAIVEKLGGKIWVESNSKNGTTFYFNIPLKEMKERTLYTEKKTSDGLAKVEK